MSQGVRSRAALAASMLCASLCLAPSAATRSAPAHEDQAFALYQAAGEDFKARDFESAVEKLESAYALFPKAIILIKLAEGLEHLGRIEEAQAAFARVEPEGVEMAERVESSLRRLSVQLARPVSVSILTGDVRGARVVVDGVDTGFTAPVVVDMPRGPHVLQLFKPGYQPHVIDPLEVVGSATIVVDVDLVPDLHVVTVDLGGQAVEAVAASLDGEPVLLSLVPGTGMAMFWAPAGQHDFTCVSPRGDVSRSFEVDGIQRAEVSCTALDDNSTLVVGLIATGSAVFVGGAALLTWHLIDLEIAREESASIEPVIPHRDIWGPVLMVAGATTGLLSLAFLPGDEPGGLSSVQPVWLPTEGGSLWGIAGRF